MNRIDETRRLGRQLAEIHAVVPTIVFRRAMRLGRTGAARSRMNHAELSRMTAEKWQAASESTFAMTLFAMRQQMAFAQSFWWAAWAPWVAGSADRNLAAADPVAGMLNAGIAPYHRIATANARRLRKR